jgi:transglutaminase-like putative cysteine protease
MPTTAGCLMSLDVTASTDAVLSVGVAGATTSEQLVVEVDGQPVPARELAAHHGTRLHAVRLTPGLVSIRYDVELEPATAARKVTELDAMVSRRPSRYCPSDQLGQYALTQFGPARADTVERVVEWVRGRLVYDGSASRPVDSAVDTLLTGRGVCRDYAHLVVTLLRALDVPARVASVYAPGLWPMDFHAVAEVAVDGSWQVYDATGLAPRPALVRIATGRDAADTAFLTLTGGVAALTATEVWAWTDGDLPRDADSHLA